MLCTLCSLTSAAIGALWLTGCADAPTPPGDPSGNPPPPDKRDLDVHRTAAPVAGSAFQCTGTWPSSLTPCGYAWTSQPATSAYVDGTVVHLSMHRTPIPVDGGASVIFVDLETNSATVVSAKAWESTTHFGTAQPLETSRPTSGWIDPFVTGATMGTRDAGQFSLSFVWGTISGTYDTSQ
ncbi:MAG: hypothetical protein E6J90_09815 [Deltaproteobacteria bacterium]|nr:MAG: hypothetical protein E6J90_09815 [Deltaproteobacteria bacterium]